jgi:hypothetical protein
MLDKQPLNKKQLIFFLAANPLQAPLVEKWNGDLPRNKRRKSMDTQSNTQTLCLCRMAYSRSLEKSFDGLKDMETSQNKKRSSSNACLAIVEKSKNKSAAKKYPNLWLGFKAMNALNASEGLEEIAHKSVTELVKFGMNEKEALECQGCVTSYPFVPQELWPSANDLGEQNYHHTQIPSEVDVCEGFAMDYHVALFFHLDDMIIPKEKALDKITKRLDEMKILLGEDISDPIAIMCTHGGK